MTPDEINRRLAVEIEGWQEFPYRMAYGGTVYCPPGVELHASNIRPIPDYYHSRIDALMVFDRIASVSIDASICANRTESGLVYDVAFMLSHQRGVHEEHTSLPAAICLAALEWVESTRKESGHG